MTELEQIEALLQEFRRPCPNTEEYNERLAEEFEIIVKQRFTEYFLKIRHVLDLNSDIPHMTRRSAGSVIVGQGEMQSRDNSQFLQVSRRQVKTVAIDQYINQT
jgi:hypothetical protein